MNNHEAKQVILEADSCFCKHGAYKDCHSGCKYRDALDAAVKALEQEPRWIPCSEKLPEYGEEVLTCSNGRFIEIQSLENGYGGYWENQKGDWSDLDEIIAWMPLPAPYEPQESEDKE